MAAASLQPGRYPLCDFTQERTLRPFLSPELASKIDQCIEAAAILKRASTHPLLGDKKYGMKFAINTGVLAELMSELGKRENQIVVELAGGTGENGLLLGFSKGVEEVYINDLCEPNTDVCKALTKQMPVPVQRKIRVETGDALTFVERHRDLVGRVSLVVCRNLLHFLNPEERERFLSQIHTMLAPGGTLFLTANRLPVSDREELPPDATMFQFTQALIDLDDGPARPLLVQKSVCDQISFDYEKYQIYSRKRGQKWTVDQIAFRSIPDGNFRVRLQECIEKNKEKLKKIQQGGIRVVISSVSMFTEENLKKLLERNQFDGVETLTLNSATGASITEEDPLYLKQTQLMALAKKTI